MLKKTISVICCAAGVVLSAAPRLDAEAAKLLAQEAEKSKNFTNATGETRFFSRAQLKYGLERDDYLHRWVDRPLYQDSAFLKSGGKTFLNDEAMQVMRHVLHDLYKIDGFAFFPQTKNRSDLFRAAALPGAPIKIVPELASVKALDRGGLATDFSKVLEIMDLAVKSKETFRINGKILITTYPDSTNPAYWVQLKKVLTEKYGDQFLIAPMHSLPRKIVTGSGKITAAEVRQLQDIIRKWLRHVDGYYYNYPPLDEYRRYDEKFDREVMIPLLQGILSEPEFKGKLLVWGTKVGHENFYAKGSFTYNCGGTTMLRGSVGSAVAAKADVIHMVEWDEQNENTSFRPTLYNSFSTQRIIRAFSGMAKGQLYPPQSGDDVTIPNLILSYRKILCAGETLELEVVNVPEAGKKGKAQKIELILKDISGKIIRKFSGNLADDKLAELRFNVKVADILRTNAVSVELYVNGKKFTGFSPVELRANWNGDNKWVKQPLRDLADCRMELKTVGKTADGMVKLHGKVVSKEPLHSIELLDGGDPIYLHRTDIPVQETEKTAVFTFIVGGYGYRNIFIKGTAAAKNAPSLRFVRQRVGGEAPRGNERFRKYVENNGGQLIFPGKKAVYGAFNDIVFSICVDKKELATAVLDVDISAFIPGKLDTVIYKGKISLAEIARKKMWAKVGKSGTHLVLVRSDASQRLPEKFGGREAEFTVLADPALPQSVFHIEAVDVKRKTFRSLPVTVYTPSGKDTEFSAFDFLGKHPVKVRCDVNMLTAHIAEISPVHGAAVRSSGGRALSGIKGISCGLVSNLRFMESYGHGNLADKFFRKNLDPSGSPAPQTVKLPDGRYAWKFNGRQNVAFPICSLYPYSGFEMKLTFTPDDVTKRQILLTDGHAGFTLEIRKERLFGTFYNAANVYHRPKQTVFGGKLQSGKKHEVTVRFDQQNLQIINNGKANKAVPCSGYQLYPGEFSIGHGAVGNGFAGTVSRFELRPL